MKFLWRINCLIIIFHRSGFLFNIPFTPPSRWLLRIGCTECFKLGFLFFYLGWVIDGYASSVTGGMSGDGF